MFGIASETDKFELPLLLAGLVQQLPKEGAVWPQGDRDLWLDTFSKVACMIWRLDEPAKK